MTALREHHFMALEFLQRNPGDEVGEIETEEQLAAAITYADLMKAGLVSGSLHPGKGGVHLTTSGRLAIADRTQKAQ